ncbi:hypothetical protein C8F04DRAFT_1117542 [Mycena alexandri]|uniref:Uncharacterized protein n=1 Tax=Mycena alexandri TaxID=1745969 RepID=A0AAD6SE71_9AGAR|nr:hypothetical protein C8F04DRAFT_1400818 [Mycena alexandri]KAJ7028964.1 hypothetical protein C8F04DRAFT_1117542 [Mycena alexandri]
MESEPQAVNHYISGGTGGPGGLAIERGGGGGTGEGPHLNYDFTAEHVTMNTHAGTFSSVYNFTVTGSFTNITNYQTPPPGPLPQFQRTRTRYGLTIDIEEVWKLLKSRPVPISNPFATVKLGSIIFCPSNEQGGEPAEVAFFPEADPDLGPWAPGVAGGEKTAEGWTRFNASDVCDRKLVLQRRIPDLYAWLYQATYIFSRLRVSSNFEDYVLMHTIDFQIETYGAKQKPTAGFLFLCPEKDFQITTTSFRWPEYPAYWSRDLNGVERLSRDEATRLGFPPLEFKSRIRGSSWDSNVYAGLRQFQEEERLDPDSPEYAIKWDCPLFEVCDTRIST